MTDDEAPGGEGGHGEAADGGPGDAGEDGPADATAAGETAREAFEHDPIDHASVRGGMTVGELVDEYGAAGIGAGTVHEAVDVLAEMLDDDVTTFVGLAGPMVPAGMRAIVADLIRDGHVDALVTTGANLTHDAIEAIGGKHHHGAVAGTEDADGGAAGAAGAAGDESDHGGADDDGPDHGETSNDDAARSHDDAARAHDEQLRDEGVDRIYDVYLPQEHFTALENHLREEVFPPLAEAGTVSIQRLTAELGRANAAVNEREGIDEDPGIAAAAHEADVPVFCPAVQDSVLGLQCWIYGQTSVFSLDALADMTGLNDLAHEADSAGAFLVGGGVPKNYVLQTMLVAPHAYDYAVQLTMDPPRTGGLSGATLDEARSWGKLEKSARNVSVYGDATITLPLVVAAARERRGE